uniref:Uncharacterized protein n=1 Tax=Vitis vinifera TaxID=29760 RepID=F6HBE4_VITVI
MACSLVLPYGETIYNCCAS